MVERPLGFAGLAVSVGVAVASVIGEPRASFNFLFLLFLRGLLPVTSATGVEVENSAFEGFGVEGAGDSARFLFLEVSGSEGCDVEGVDGCAIALADTEGKDDVELALLDCSILDFFLLAFLED